MSQDLVSLGTVLCFKKNLPKMGGKDVKLFSIWLLQGLLKKKSAQYIQS